MWDGGGRMEQRNNHTVAHVESERARASLRGLPEWLIGLLLAIVVTLLGFWLLGLAGAGDDPRFADPGASDDAAATAGVSFVMFDGAISSFEDFKGKPLVLNFWASWCPPCVAEMPDFQKASESFVDQVTFLGMNMQDPDRSAAERLIAETGVRYPLALDPDGALFARFGGIGMPTTVFIDADGNVVDTHTGALFGEVLEERIREAFDL